MYIHIPLKGECVLMLCDNSIIIEIFKYMYNITMYTMKPLKLKVVKNKTNGQILMYPPKAIAEHYDIEEGYVYVDILRTETRLDKTKTNIIAERDNNDTKDIRSESQRS